MGRIKSALHVALLMFLVFVAFGILATIGFAVVGTVFFCVSIGCLIHLLSAKVGGRSLPPTRVRGSASSGKDRLICL